MGVALGAEAQDGDLLGLDEGKVGVVLVEHFSHVCTPALGIESVRGNDNRRVVAARAPSVSGRPMAVTRG